MFVQCGTQPPIRPPVILECWYLYLYIVCSLLPSELKLSTYMTRRVRWRRQRMTPEARLQQAVQNASVFSGSLISGKGNLHVTMSLEQDCGQALAERNQESCQQPAPTRQACEEATRKGGPPVPAKPSGDCTLLGPRARTTCLNGSQVVTHRNHVSQ